MSVWNGFTWLLHFIPNKSGYHGADASVTENRILRKKKNGYEEKTANV